MTTQALPERVTLFFEPLDVLHFRDHRPFDAGLHTHARNIFPMPSVFLGCLRTALLTRVGARFEREDFGLTEPWARELLGSPREPGTLNLRGPFLAKKSPEQRDRPIAAFLPCPLDLRSPEKGGETREIQRALLPKARRYHGATAERVEGLVPWSRVPPLRACNPGKDQSKRDGSQDQILSIIGAGSYLKGNVPAAEDFVEESSLFKKEPRVGIVRSDQHLTADDHLLYATQPFRFADQIGFAVEVELPSHAEGRAALEALHHAIVPLGGKGHRARVHYLASALLPSSPTELPASYKLWLVTPLVLGPGACWPQEVSCVATERTVAVGGFDLAKRAPKPLRHALPAGTVLRIKGLPPDLALRRLADDPSSPSQWQHDRRTGFGVALIAKEADRS